MKLCEIFFEYSEVKLVSGIRIKRKDKFIKSLISKKLFSYSSSIKKSNLIFKVKGNIDNEVDRIGKLIKNNYLINN